MKDKEKLKELLNRGIENIYPSKEFLEDLLTNKKISIYLGIDPTGKTLHLGHAISLMKLRVFQELGHKIVLLIGSFTATIGDPTDKSATRKPLTKEQVLVNCKEYKKQASKIIKFDGENPAEFKFNGDWLEKMSFADVVDLASNFTVQRLLERDMFDKRMKEGKPISLHEFLYPLMQGYDSVAMNIDGEIGGNDQTFNMLVGRTLVKKLQKREKFVMTTKILEDPNGAKMGKTTGNMITLKDSPDQMFGAVMSWTDGMILPGLELCTLCSPEKIAEVKKKIEQGENPRDMKFLLAKEIIKIYHSEEAGEKALDNFINQFQKNEIPENIVEFKFTGEMSLIDVLVKSKLVPSSSDGRRMVKQNAVKLDGETKNDIYEDLSGFDGKVLQVGKKRFTRLNSKA